MKKIILESRCDSIEVTKLTADNFNNIVVKNSNNILVGMVDNSLYKGFSIVKKSGSKTQDFNSLEALIKYFAGSYTFHLLD